MSKSDIVNIFLIIFYTGVIMGLRKLIFGKKSNDDVFDFERDHEQALSKPPYNGEESPEEAVFIGTSQNKKNVFIPSEAKHVFVCGTTGSGKTIALSNFLASGAEHKYPMLIIER